MTPKEEEDFSEEHDDSIEPIIFIPPTITTISITDLPSLKKVSYFARFSGVIYSLIASLLFTCSAFSIKQIDVDILDALVLRFFLQTLSTLIFGLYKNYSLFPGTKTEKFYQILCCATGAGGLFLYFISMRYIELSDITTLFYTKVVWTVLFSLLIYRERPSISLLIALPLTFSGVVFVTQPSFLFSSSKSSNLILNNKYRILGLTLSIIGSFTSTANVLSFKKLVSTSKDVKPSILNFQYSFLILIFLILGQLYQKFFLHSGLSFNTFFSWKYLFASFICLGMMLSNIFTQKAIKHEHPAVYTLLGSADIIFALILQNIFTNKHSNLFALLGSTLVILSVLIIGLAKLFQDRHIKKKNPIIEKC